MDLDLGNFIVSTTGAAYVTNLLVNGFTLARPERRAWIAFGLALVLGIVATAVLTLASLPPDVSFTRQTYAQIVIVGIFAAGGAAGASVTQASATAKREQVTRSEPDPTTPVPRSQP